MPAFRWRFWIFLLILVVVYFTLNLALGLGRLAPDLLTVAVLLAARRLTGAGAAALGLILGLMRDALSLTAFGASAVALSFVGFIGARSRDLFLGEGVLFVGIYLFAGTYIHDVLFYFLARSTFRETVVSYLFMYAPLSAAYAALAGVVALVSFRFVAREL